MKKEWKVKSRTLSKYRTCMISIIKLLGGRIDNTLIPQIKVKGEAEIFTFEREEINKMLKKMTPAKTARISSKRRSWRMKRACILALTYACALRAGEVADLLRSDLNLKKRFLRVRAKKSDTVHKIPIIDELVLKLLRRYLEGAKLKPDEPLFPHDRSNTPYLARAISGRIFVDLTEPIKVEERTFHSFRHSRATHLIEDGMKLNQVQKLLRHKSIKSTEIYDHATAEGLRGIFEEMNIPEKTMKVWNGVRDD